jgi:cytidine deaminase
MTPAWVKYCDVKRAKVIAFAFNKHGTLITKSTNRRVNGHPYKFTFCAEELLIRKLHKIKARERFGDLHLVVMRWSKTRGWAMARPCTSCQNLISNYGFKRISYTGRNGQLVTV